MKGEKTISEAVVKAEKTTRGKVDRIDRVEWFYLKKHHGLSDPELSVLNRATRPALVNGRAASLVRVFDPEKVKEKGVAIEDFESLDQYPELILFEGYHVPGRGGTTAIEKRNGAGASFLTNKIESGAITRVGFIPEKTGSQKLLGGFGKFLMMGGFMLILILGVGIVIAISVMSNGC